MAILGTDGFDIQDIGDRWVSGFGTWSGANLAGSPRFGASGYSVYQTSTVTVYYHRMFGEKATVIVGFAFKNNQSNATGFALPICSLWGDARATQHLYIGQATSTNKIEIRRGNWTGTLLATSATATIPLNTWCYIEVKATLHDTTGSCEVRLNGASAVSVSGVDTKNGGTLGTFSSLMIGSQANYGGAATLSWDDLYICDNVDGTTLTPSQGAAFNDYLGDVRVRTLLPNAAGSSTQFATTGSGTNYENVNDVPPVTTTYNSSGVSGQRDTYNLDNASIAGGDSVLAVVASNWMLRDNTGAISAKTAVKSGSTVGYGASNALTTSRVLYQDAMALDPATSATWANAAIDSLEIGAEVV